MDDLDRHDDLDDDLDDDLEDGALVLGAVVEAGRGSLPFALVHGEALVACASWALSEAGIRPLDLATPWADVVGSGAPLVLHDPLCPMTPAAFLSHCVATAVAHDRVVVGVRPVTDTVKVVRDGGLVGETLDREALVSLASPVVLPARVVAALDTPPGTDLGALVADLAGRFEVERVLAPPEARRVADVGDVRVLEALTAPG